MRVKDWSAKELWHSAHTPIRVIDPSLETHASSHFSKHRSRSYCTRIDHTVTVAPYRILLVDPTKLRLAKSKPRSRTGSIHAKST